MTTAPDSPPDDPADHRSDPDPEATQLRGLLAHLGLDAPTDEEVTAVLDLTRVVAHSTQRRFGPVTIWALAASLPSDASPTQRLAALTAALRAMDEDPPV